MGEWVAKQAEKRRQPSADQRISAACLECFTTPAGKLVLDYLKVELVNKVMPPESSDAALRYREGQRSVIGILEQRMKEASHAARSLVA